MHKVPITLMNVKTIFALIFFCSICVTASLQPNNTLLAPLKRHLISEGELEESLVNALLGNRKNSQKELQLLGIHSVYADQPILISQANGKFLDSEIYNVDDYFTAVMEEIEQTEFYKHFRSLKTNRVSIHQNIDVIDFSSVKDIVLDGLTELLLNSIYVFESDNSNTRMIIAFSFDSNNNEFHIYSLDNGKGIVDIPKAVETYFSGYKGKETDLGGGKGLPFFLTYMYLLKSGRFTIESKGIRYHYKHDKGTSKILRSQSSARHSQKGLTFIHAVFGFPEQEQRYENVDLRDIVVEDLSLPSGFENRVSKLNLYQRSS